MLKSCKTIHEGANAFRKWEDRLVEVYKWKSDGQKGEVEIASGNFICLTTLILSFSGQNNNVLG